MTVIIIDPVVAMTVYGIVMLMTRRWPLMTCGIDEGPDPAANVLLSAAK